MCGHLSRLRASKLRLRISISGRLLNPATRRELARSHGRPRQTRATPGATDGRRSSRPTPARQGFLCGSRQRKSLNRALSQPLRSVGLRALASTRSQQTEQQARQGRQAQRGRPEIKRQRLLFISGLQPFRQAQREPRRTHGLAEHLRPTLRGGLAQSQPRQAQALRFGKRLYL